MAALEELKEFEKRIDATVAGMDLLKLPLNVVLAGLYVVIDGFFHGHRNDMNSAETREIAGYASASRLSYLLPVLAKCPTMLGGATVAESITSIPESRWEELRLLLQYGHFCELMPEVHRGLYNISGGNETYTLEHASEAVAAGEARDTVLTELALPFRISSRIDDGRFDALVAKLPTLDLVAAGGIIKELFDHYAVHAYEAPLLSDDAFSAATGASYSEFERFRSGWAAVADFATGMAAAVTRKAHRTGVGVEREGLFDELVEWIAVCLKSDFLSGVVIAVAGLESSKFDALMRFFSTDARSGAVDHAGEGFFPPIVEYESAYQFSPDVLRVMLSGRNVPYALNRIDKRKFDDHVSHDLEPQLLRAAAPIFARVADVQVVTNHGWKRGEIDVLVYSASTNAALHVQAKAALPAQGARMVQRGEGRSREGLQQLKDFRDLPQAARDGILSTALGTPVRDVAVTDVLLCRSGLGTNKVWAELGDVVPLNLTLLHAVVDQLVKEKCSVADFGTVGRQLLEDVCGAVIRGWNPASVSMGDVTLTVPLLDLDNQALHSYRLRWHPP